MRMGMFLTHGGGPCSPLPLLLVLCLFVGGGFGYAVYGEEPRNSNDAMQVGGEPFARHPFSSHGSHSMLFSLRSTRYKSATIKSAKRL
jgi:hypothetical protein